MQTPHGNDNARNFFVAIKMTILLKVNLIGAAETHENTAGRPRLETDTAQHLRYHAGKSIDTSDAFSCRWSSSRAIKRSSLFRTVKIALE